LRHFTDPEFWKAYELLPASVRRLADRNFQILQADPAHPSLRLKSVGRYWSVRVGIHHRALAVKDGDDMIWFWIGTHSRYDQLTR
jgi:hypothetical protein